MGIGCVSIYAVSFGIHSSEINAHSNDLSISPINLATRVRLMKSVHPVFPTSLPVINKNESGSSSRVVFISYQTTIVGWTILY